MDRYFQYTPSYRPQLLRSLVGRRLTGVTSHFPATTDPHAEREVATSCFGHPEGMLTLTLAGGVAVDVTGMYAVRSLLLRTSNELGFKWGEYGLLVHSAILDARDVTGSEAWLWQALGKRIEGLNILRIEGPKLSYGGRPSDVGIELRLEDGKSLIVGTRLTTARHSTAAMPWAGIDPELASRLSAVDVNSVAHDEPMDVAQTDPSTEASQRALRDHLASLSSEVVEYDIFKHRVITLGSSKHLNEASVADLRAIKSYLIEQNRSITDIRFYIDAEGRVAVAVPIDVGRGVSPDATAMVIDALCDLVTDHADEEAMDARHE